jgi:hypothetical protein
MLGSNAVVACVLLAVPPLRRRVVRYLTEWLLVLRTQFIVWPLRLMTGRWRPDHGRIAALERECGIAQASPASGGLFAGLSPPLWLRNDSASTYEVAEHCLQAAGKQRGIDPSTGYPHGWPAKPPAEYTMDEWRRYISPMIRSNGVHFRVLD